MQTIIELRRTAIELRRKAAATQCPNEFAGKYLALALRYEELADRMTRNDLFVDNLRKLG